MRSVGQTAVSGAFWMLASTIALKGVGVAGQLGLGWLLLPDDLGLVALAFAAVAFFDLIQITGIREILIRRSRRVRHWLTPAFSLATMLGFLSGLLLAAAAYPLAHTLNDPRLAPLLLLMAAGLPLNAMSAILRGYLEASLRFRVLAASGAALNVTRWVLVLGFAALGLGPFSVVGPVPIVAAIRLLVLAIAAAAPIKASLDWRKWRYFLHDSRFLVGTYLLATWVWQGDYLILRLFCDTADVGAYFFAFGLSTQTVMLLGTNAGTVLLPSFVRLPDLRRQGEAFLSAAGVLSLVGFPACFLQAILAKPLLSGFFGSKWDVAAPILTVLSLGMCVRLVEWVGESLLKAQGRYRTFMLLYLIHAVLATALVVPAASLVGPLAVAAAVSGCLAVVGALRLHVILRPSQLGSRRLLPVVVAPLACCAVAAGIAMGADALLVHWIGDEHYILQIVWRATILLGAYLPLSLTFAPTPWRELRRRLGPSGRQIWSRLTRGAAS